MIDNIYLFEWKDKSSIDDSWMLSMIETINLFIIIFIYDRYEVEEGFSKNKPVRYDFDEALFPGYSWKGYVHLNRVVGEVSQTVHVERGGTFRMIINYVNKNANVTKLHVRVKSVGDHLDEQNAFVVSFDVVYQWVP